MVKAISVDKMCRSYHVKKSILSNKEKKVEALSSISIDVEQGELFGLIGPNGAGKTTLVKILSTLLLPSSGNASVLGLDVCKHEKEIRKRIGFMLGGERGLYWRLSGKNNLCYFADMYGISPRIAKSLIPHLLDKVGLGNRGDEKVQGYSRGMKQRLHIARTLLSDPELIFLDEPTNGMDPIATKETHDLIKELVKSGKTILMTTHNMNEAELSDRVAVINRGSIVAINTPTELKKNLSDLGMVEVSLKRGTYDSEDLFSRFETPVKTTDNTDGTLSLTFPAPNGMKDIPSIINLLNGIPVSNLAVRQATLTDVYWRLIGGIND